MSFEKLKQEVDNGMKGKNSGIPMGFNRLNKYMGIRKRLYYLTGGLTGSGKTSFIDDAFVLNPYDWYMSKENTNNLKIKIIYRSMERSRVYKHAKWMSRKIFIDNGTIIPVSKLLGWTEKMNHDEHDLFLSYADYINNMEDVIVIIDGPENPIAIAKHLKAHAEKNGTIEQIDQYNKIYIPNDSEVVTLVIIDHIGLLKTTKEMNSKKAVIDKMSDELRYARDFYGYSPVVVQQLNRDIANPMRIKNGDVEPQLEDFKDTSQTQDDADLVIALFDPMRYKVPDPSGYNLAKLKDDYGAKYFRSLRLIKNSYGEDDIRIGLGFLGQVGLFKELPRMKEMTDADYENIISRDYFLR